MKKHFVIFVIVFLVTIGFAAVNTVLDITGNINVAENIEDFKIEITNLKINNNEKKEFISKDKESFTFTGSGNDTINYTVTNYSYQYDANIILICVPSENITIEQINNLPAQERSTKSITSTSTSEITCTIRVEKISRTDYAEDMCKYVEGTVWTFGYTGAEQEFTVPCDGNYKIEAWGSQGGTSSSRQGVTYIGGYGAYSTGEISLLHERKLYIQVGGNQQKFNGGTGSGENSGNPSGGDSTNILFESTNLSNLKDDKEKIMIVAAGGGGGFGYKTVSTSDYSGSGGNAGGISGNNANRSGLCYWIASGATQTSGGRISYCSGINSSIDGGIKTGQYGSFGVGGNSLGSSGAGGGGGYYGGSFSHYAGGSGGSSYIGNPLLTNKVMYCYNCAQSSDAATKTISNTCTSATPTSNCSKQGNGYAKITYLGE